MWLEALELDSIACDNKIIFTFGVLSDDKRNKINILATLYKIELNEYKNLIGTSHISERNRQEEVVQFYKHQIEKFAEVVNYVRNK